MKILRAGMPKCDHRANHLGEKLRQEVRRNVVAVENQRIHLDRVASNMAAIFDGVKEAVEENGERR